MFFLSARQEGSNYSREMVVICKQTEKWSVIISRTCVKNKEKKKNIVVKHAAGLTEEGKRLLGVCQHVTGWQGDIFGGPYVSLNPLPVLPPGPPVPFFPRPTQTSFSASWPPSPPVGQFYTARFTRFLSYARSSRCWCVKRWGNFLFAVCHILRRQTRCLRSKLPTIWGKDFFVASRSTTWREIHSPKNQAAYRMVKY